MRVTTLLLLFLSGARSWAQPDAAAAPAPSKQALIDFLVEYMEVRYPGLNVHGDILYVSVQHQELYHVKAGVLQGTYVISTAVAGLGSELDSYRTPTGLHYVREKIGAQVPTWGILQERRFNGAIADSTGRSNADVITSRILRLAGMESGVNAGGDVDSYARSIYVHGTADESSIGTPSSHGCIRMRNRDVVSLFNEVPIGALVVILDN